MAKRIGIVQTRGMGDIIIALPIADHFLNEGYEVFWPIDETFLEMFAPVKPSINFLAVKQRIPNNYDYFLNDPLKLLHDYGCARIIVLYSHLGSINIPNLRYSASFKLDEYKYAVAGIPFERKWQLTYERDLVREETLFDSLGIKGDYVCIHDQSSMMKEPIEVRPELTDGLEIVRISPVTDSIFDWRLTIERAAKLIMVDSCFANLVEQLNLENEKALFLQWPIAFTPVYANGWQFVFPESRDRV